jgi:hypothetical protein
MYGSLQVMERLIEIFLIYTDFGDFKKSVPSELLIRTFRQNRRILTTQHWCCIFDNLFEVEYGFILMVLLLKNFTLVKVGLCIFIIFL